MARIQFSPLITGASGKVKDTVFSKWKGRAYIRARVIPSNPQSVDQMAVRVSMSRVVLLWQSMAPALKTTWGVYASPYSISGYNAFVSANRALEQLLELLVGMPHNPDIEDFPAVTAVTGANAGEINISWDHGTSTEGGFVYVFARMNDTNEFVGYQTNVRLFNQNSMVVTGLAPNELHNLYIGINTNRDVPSKFGKTWSTAKVRAHA